MVKEILASRGRCPIADFDFNLGSGSRHNRRPSGSRIRITQSLAFCPEDAVLVVDCYRADFCYSLGVKEVDATISTKSISETNQRYL